MYKTTTENGQESIDIDGTRLPVYQLDPDRQPSTRTGCANCDWHAMTEEEHWELAALIDGVLNAT